MPFPKGYSTPSAARYRDPNGGVQQVTRSNPLDQPIDTSESHAAEYSAVEGVREARMGAGQTDGAGLEEAASTGAELERIHPTNAASSGAEESGTAGPATGSASEHACGDEVQPGKATRGAAGIAAGSGSSTGRPRRNPQPPTHPKLWANYRSEPGIETRNELVVAYHSLVRDVVRRFSARLPRSVDRGDLLTAGSVGLMSAIEGFDPERGVRFESYCELRVKGALLDELRTQDWLPRPWRQRVELQKRTVERLRSELGRRPDDDEVAEAMGLGIDTYRQVFGTGLPNAPTGSMASGDEEDGALTMEVVPDRQAEAPDERLSREELLKLVAQKLTQQEYRIVYLKYWEELPMREIGDLTGLSESRVCKIHAKLILRLRDRFRSDQDAE